jgi:two-component system, OmpR family, phosphate regulon response regulator PhoB
MTKVLVIEDEQDLRQVLEYNLQQAHHEVVLSASGRQGLEFAQSLKPDVVILDLMLPDLSGKDVCKSLKHDERTKHIPVIMLTARGEEVDRIVGFELGADDYITKPFSVRELLLRVAAVVRRAQSAPESGNEKISFGVLVIDKSAHRAWAAGEEIELSALEFKLLMHLYERKDRVQSRGALLDEVWGMRADITTRTVDTHVKRLREKLGSARNYVETVRGVGYRFVASPDEVGV